MFGIQDEILDSFRVSLCGGATLLADLSIAGTTFQAVQVGTVARVNFTSVGLPSSVVSSINVSGTGLGVPARQTYWLYLYAQSNTPCNPVETLSVSLSDTNVLTVTNVDVTSFVSSDVVVVETVTLLRSQNTMKRTRKGFTRGVTVDSVVWVRVMRTT